MSLRQVILLSAAAALILFSSCVSVIQGRNYAHLKYVKVKDHHKAVTTNSDQNAPVEMLSSRKDPQRSQVTDQHDAQLKERKFTSHVPVLASNAWHATSARAESMKSAKQAQAPMLNKRQEKKLESKPDQLFGDMDHDLRLGLLLIIAGIVVALFVFIPTVGWIFGVVATILVLIGLVYIIKYIVEKG